MRRWWRSSGVSEHRLLTPNRKDARWRFHGEVRTCDTNECSSFCTVVLSGCAVSRNSIRKPCCLSALREAFRAGSVWAKRHRVYADHHRRTSCRRRDSACRSSALSSGRAHRLWRHPEAVFGAPAANSIGTQQCFLVRRHFCRIGRRDSFLAFFVSRRPASVQANDPVLNV